MHQILVVMTGNTVVNRDKPPAFIELIFEEAEGYIKYIYMLDDLPHECTHMHVIFDTLKTSQLQGQRVLNTSVWYLYFE